MNRLLKIGKEFCTIWITWLIGNDQVYLDKNCKPSFESRRICIGVWKAFCGWKKGLLVILSNGYMNQHWHYKEILIEHGFAFYETNKEMW